MNGFRGSLIKIFSALIILVVVNTSLISSSYAVSDPNYQSALWVAENDGVLKVTTSTGEILFKIDDIGRVYSVVTDGERGRLWLVTSDDVYVYNFSGQRLYKVSSPFDDLDRSDRVLMVMDESDGSVWLAHENDMVKLNQSAQRVVRRSYYRDIESLSFDKNNQRVWVANSRRVFSINALNGEWVSYFYPVNEYDSNDKHEIDDKHDSDYEYKNDDEHDDEHSYTTSLKTRIHYDVLENVLWVLKNEHLVRYDINGNKQFSSQLSPLDDFTLDGQGNIWASNNNSLYYLSNADSVIFKATPFTWYYGGIKYLVVNPFNQSIWVANNYKIVNYTKEGVEKHRLQTSNKIKSLAYTVMSRHQRFH